MTATGGPQLHTMHMPTLESATIQREHGHFLQLFWKNKHATITYCCVFWSFGMCVAFLGPTLLDLGCMTGSDFEHMSWVFFFQSLFMLIGCLCGGVLVERFTSNPVLFVSTIIIVVTMAIIPFCRVIGVLAVVLAIMGLNMGVIDTVANVSLINLYGTEVSPFLQALHFFYGLGAFVSPMIAEPFLLNEDCSPFIDDTNNTQEIAEMYKNGTLITETLEEAQQTTRVRFAFWIMTALQIPVCLMVLSICAKKQITKGTDIITNSTMDTSAAGDKQREEYLDMDVTKSPATKKRDFSSTKQRMREECCASQSYAIIMLTAFAAILLFLYDGLQAAYGGYVYSYAFKSIADLNKTEAAYLNACFWGLFALGRLLSIPIATKFSPGFMLLCNIIGCLTSMIFMLALRHNHVVLYVGTCSFGIFLSSVYPTAISLVEQFVTVTSSMTSALVVSAATGEMIMPVVVGHLFVSVGPISFLLWGNICCFLSSFVFVAIWLTGQFNFRHKAMRSGFGGVVDICCPRAVDDDNLVGPTRVKYYNRMSDSSMDSGTPDINDKQPELNLSPYTPQNMPETS